MSNDNNEKRSDDIREQIIDAIGRADGAVIVTARVEDDGLAMSVARFISDDLEGMAKPAVAFALSESVTEEFGLGNGGDFDLAAHLRGALGDSDESDDEAVAYDAGVY